MVNIIKIDGISDKDLLTVMQNSVIYHHTNDISVPIEQITIDPTFEYLKLTHKGELIGFWAIKPVTKLVVEAHIFCLPKFSKTDILKKAIKATSFYVLKNTSYKKVLCYVPNNCTHVIRLVSSLEFHLDGLIQDGIIYQNKLVDLLIFSKNLSELL